MRDVGVVLKHFPYSVKAKEATRLSLSFEGAIGFDSSALADHGSKHSYEPAEPIIHRICSLRARCVAGIERVIASQIHHPKVSLRVCCMKHERATNRSVPVHSADHYLMTITSGPETELCKACRSSELLDKRSGHQAACSSQGSL